ncbi:putative ferrichrome binding protein [Staphylococcus gallinarum]|uniref:Putative ferrichrome binding protein n=1 Tax=Staphylococcus gallinarum TaxID=1293 RepID=A0A380FK57_STAGA|nr:putative ferrichrome binding protein [Staphylococcus gallinarum]
MQQYQSSMNFDKKLYSYGPNWGRGGEVLYQAFGLKMPEKLDKLVKKRRLGLKLNKKKLCRLCW